MRNTSRSITLALLVVAGMAPVRSADAALIPLASPDRAPRPSVSAAFPGGEPSVQVRDEGTTIPSRQPEERARQRRAHGAATLDLLTGAATTQLPGSDRRHLEAFGGFLDRAIGGHAVPVRSDAAAAAPGTAAANDAATDATATDRGFVDDPDLTGDGLADALTYEARYRNDGEWWAIEALSLVAVQGTDGAPLWSRDLPPGENTETFLASMRDVDGDGAQDLWLLTVTYGSWYTPEAWSFTVVSGATGGGIWGREIDARAQTERTQSLYRTVVPAVAVLPFEVDDRNGDDLPDVLLEMVSMTYTMDRTAVGPVRRYADGRSSSTRASFIAGDTGTEIEALTKSSAAQVSVLEPAGQSVGDPAEDYAWVPATPVPASSDELCIQYLPCRPTPTIVPAETMFSVEMIDGASRQAAWSLELPPTPYDWPVDVLGRDLDADGGNDLLAMTRWVEEDEGWVWSKGLRTLTRLDGATGADVWEQGYEESAWAWYSARLGAAGGAPGDDLLVFADEVEDDFRTAFIRLDGAAGTTLLRTATIATWDVRLSDDVDRDGVNDLVIEAMRESAPETYASGIHVESGADGATLYDATMAGWYDNLYAAGDLDGDGAADLLRVTETDHRRSQDVRLALVNVLDGAERWVVTHHLDARASMALHAQADATGDGGRDLGSAVGVLDEDAPAYASSIQLAAGSDGLARWERGDVLPDPPRPATGSISGRVLDAGGTPLEGMCAQPHPAGGWSTYASRTATDGSFTIDQLDAGGYTLRFLDCDTGRYASEWFEDAATAETATTVTVGDGQAVTLPDVRLALLPGPVNDLIADALPISSLPFTDARSVADATSEPGEPENCWNERSIWYRIEPTTSIDVRATLRDAAYDLGMGWYEVIDGELEELGCAGTADDGTVTATQPLEAGRTYLLRVAGHEWTRTGVDLLVEQTVLPRISGRVTDRNGDPIADVCVLIAAESPWSSTTWLIEDDATTDADGRYRSRPLYGGPYRIEFEDCEQQRHVAEWFDDVGTFPEATGVELGASGRDDIDAELDGPLPGPVNDDLRDAMRVTLPADDRRSTLTATQQLFEPLLCGPVGGTVWYRFTAPANGTVTIDTRGSNFDTFLGAYLQQPTPATTLGCNDDTHLQAAYLEIPVVAGRSYVVQAGGYQGARGALTLTMRMLEPAVAEQARSQRFPDSDPEFGNPAGTREGASNRGSTAG